jgi:hypothetical protein
MAEASLKQLLASAGLVFTGRLIQIGASTVSGLPDDGRLSIVEIVELLKHPPGLDLPAGARVTVRLSDDLPLPEPDEQWTFFTNGWVYGETLAVTEVGRMPVDQTAARTATFAGQSVSIVSQALDELAQDDVLAHARDADAVVRGRVVSLSEVPEPSAPREHDPDWWIASLGVDLVEKGDVPGFSPGQTTNVGVLYANSQDYHWREAPKPKASQAGAWLLHRAPEALQNLAPFQILHPVDLQPSVQIELFRERGL